MKLSRRGVRFGEDALERIDLATRRYAIETGNRPSRAAIMRAVVERGLMGIDDERPIAEQLTVRAPAIARAPVSRPTPGESLRARLVRALEARPGEVLTPARLVSLVGAASRDSVRNALLVLASQRRIEKRGAGQYQARPPAPESAPETVPQGDRAPASRTRPSLRPGATPAE